MSIVIVGGNECMTHRYRKLCEEYKCKAKIYAKKAESMKGMGTPDLLVLFTNTMSHKMLRNVMNETKGQNVRIERCYTSSLSALKNLLEEIKEENYTK